MPNKQSTSSSSSCYQKKFAHVMHERKHKKEPSQQTKAIAHSVAKKHCGSGPANKRK